MNYASQDLIRDHDAILFALRVLDEISDRVHEGKDAPPGDIIELIDFLKLFADKCHYSNEFDTIARFLVVKLSESKK